VPHPDRPVERGAEQRQIAVGCEHPTDPAFPLLAVVVRDRDDFLNAAHGPESLERPGVHVSGEPLAKGALVASRQFDHRAPDTRLLVRDILEAARPLWRDVILHVRIKQLRDGQPIASWRFNAEPTLTDRRPKLLCFVLRFAFRVDLCLEMLVEAQAIVLSLPFEIEMPRMRTFRPAAPSAPAALPKTVVVMSFHRVGLIRISRIQQRFPRLRS
jgi:hypothetical protein